MRNTKNSTKAISTKEANAKIENNQQLTKEEIAQLQESAQTRQLAFVDAFKQSAQKRNDVTVTKVSSKNNLSIKTKNSAVAEICRKEKYTAIYTCRCTDTKERNAILKAFKNTDAIKTCNTKKYLDSKETRIELIVESNTVNKAFLDLIIKTCDSLREQRQTMKKAK